MLEPTSCCDMPSPIAPAPLSKNARKRQLKEEKYQQLKSFRKQHDKEKKELKKRKISNVGEDRRLDVTAQLPLTDEMKAEAVEARRIKKETIKNDFERKCKSNFSVIIDCSWEKDHNEKSLKSLSQQIGFTYGFNRNSPNPCDLHVTNVGQLLSHKLQKNNADTWWSVNILKDKDFIDLEQFITTVTSPTSNDTFQNGIDRKKELIYLTSDASETLITVSKDCAYIIGGIVDRNRLRNITYQKAVALGIRTAKLPIRENIDLKSTHVLTVNHVFEILLNFQAENDWKIAIEKVIPSRKEAKNDDNNNDNNDDNNDKNDNSKDNVLIQ